MKTKNQISEEELRILKEEIRGFEAERAEGIFFVDFEDGDENSDEEVVETEENFSVRRRKKGKRNNSVKKHIWVSEFKARCLPKEKRRLNKRDRKKGKIIDDYAMDGILPYAMKGCSYKKDRSPIMNSHMAKTSMSKKDCKTPREWAKLVCK